MADAAAEAFTPAAREALAAFPIDGGVPELVSISENVTFRVRSPGRGPAWVLRLHRPGYRVWDELMSERQWVRALDASGIVVPAPVVARDGQEYVAVHVAATGEDRYVSLSRWAEGRLLSDVLEETTDVEGLERHFAQAGALVATMHNQATSWRVPARFRRPLLDAGGLLGEEPVWGRFWESRLLSDGERRRVIEARDRMRGALDRYGRRPETFSVIHSDLHPGNLVLDGARLAAIDFDDCGYGWHQYDIAAVLFQSWTHPQAEIVERAFLRGYRLRRPLAPRDLALLPMFQLIRGLAMVGWLHDRPEFDGSRLTAWLKDAVCEGSDAFEPPC